MLTALFFVLTYSLLIMLFFQLTAILVDLYNAKGLLKWLFPSRQNYYLILQGAAASASKSFLSDGVNPQILRRNPERYTPF
jgi:hypothetical protein